MTNNLSFIELYAVILWFLVSAIFIAAPVILLIEQKVKLRWVLFAGFIGFTNFVWFLYAAPGGKV